MASPTVINNQITDAVTQDKSSGAKSKGKGSKAATAKSGSGSAKAASGRPGKR